MKVRLDEVCNIYKGKTTITKAVQGEYPLVVTAENRASHNEYQFDCKAVCVPLVSATGHGHASIKRLHYQEGKFALGTILSAVIPKDESILDTRYLYIYLSYFKDSVLVPLMRGSANVSLTIKSLGSAEIELPSIEKQKSIVELITKIESRKCKVDIKLEEQRKIVSLFRKEILSLAVKGKLVKQDESDEPATVLINRITDVKNKLINDNKIKKEKLLPEIDESEIPYKLPKGWEWARLGLLSQFIDYRGKTPKKTDSGTRLITAKNIKFGYLSMNPEEFISDEEYETWMVRGIPEYGDVIFTTEAPLGNVAQLFINEKFALAQRAITFRVFENFNKSYLKYTLMSTQIRDMIFSKATGTTALGIKASKLKEIIIPVPPLNEQNRIVEKIEKLMEICDELELRIEKSKKYSEQLMELILKDSFKA